MIHRSLYKIVILLLLISSRPHSVAGKTDYMFRTLSPPDGLTFDGLNGIVQDEDGFIWIMSGQNIIRFNGYDYKYYYSFFYKLDPNKRWSFHSLIINREGKLYASSNNGLFEYDKKADSFKPVFQENLSKASIANDGNLWLYYDNNIHLYNIYEDKLIKPSYNNTPLQELSYYPDIGNDIFCAPQDNHLYYYNRDSQELNLFYTFPESTKIVDFRISNDILWVLVKNAGLYEIDLKSRQHKNLHPVFITNKMDNIDLKALHIDKNGQIWIGTQRGLFIFNPDTRDLDYYAHSNSDPFSLINNSVWVISEDNHRNLLIGTHSGKMGYINLDERKGFKTYYNQEGRLNHSVISCFAENKDYLFIGTEGGGVNILNKHSDEFFYFTMGKDANSLSSNNIKSLSLDGDNLWIATFRGGLNSLNLKSGKITHYRNNPNDPESLTSDDLRKIILEPGKGIWIVYQSSRMQTSFFSFKEKTFSHYSFDEKEIRFYLRDMVFGKEDSLWLVSDKKLYHMSRQSGFVKEIPLDFPFFINAQTIFYDSDDNLWIGTVANGLLKYEISTGTCSVHDEILNEKMLIIHNITNDNDNNLWLGTNDGLFKYDPENKTYLKFEVNEGMQGEYYYPLAAYKGDSDLLYFGGTSGFTTIDPEKITTNTYKPKAIITDFLIDNIPVNTNVNPSVEQPVTKLILDHNQTNFGFKFSSDNYLIPGKNRFRYRLKGYDDRWTETDASERSAYYSKVSPGEYIFEVLAANNDGIWSDTPTCITIKRLPTPWLSRKAYILYLLFLILIIYMIIRYYYKQKDLKWQLYTETLDKQKKEDIHQSQLRFFTNISHDFRTPLSLIIAEIEKLRREGMKEYDYRILNSNAQRLLNMVNELMDFRKLENGKMQLKVRKTDINKLIQDIANDFVDYAKQHSIHFRLLLDPALPKELYADKKIIEKIILNLLNNSFKYTADGGSVTIESYSEPSRFKPVFETNYSVKSDFQLKHSFCIAIRDTGVGISKETIHEVFDRFYKVDTSDANTHLGTGIGLALVKSLVILHKGMISIFSKRGEGTEFIVYFSDEASLYRSEEISTEETEETEKQLPSAFVQKKEESPLPKVSDTDKDKNRERNKKKILFVEDNEDLRELLKNYLSNDYKILEAANGMIASELLENTHVDLIISDIMMPIKDGITLCHDIKSDINTSHIPFILLTAKTSLESKTEGFSAGADIYFEKPLDFNLLLLSIQNLFRRQQMLKDHYAKNYFADAAELCSNEQDTKFLKRLVEIIELNIDQTNTDVNYIASELSMSRSKLYTKVKSLTGKSIVEFILNQRLRKAARLLIEKDFSVRQVMDEVGIESQSYFTKVFKKEFGDTPAAFVARHKKKNPVINQ